MLGWQKSQYNMPIIGMPCMSLPFFSASEKKKEKIISIMSIDSSKKKQEN
jgi:hypothetical protein